MTKNIYVPLDLQGNQVTNAADPTTAQALVTRNYLVAKAQQKVTVVVGTNSIDYTTDGTADDVQLQAALDAVHTAGGGMVEVATAIQLAAMITMYPDVVLKFHGHFTPVTISTSFSGGVVFRENSGAADYLTILDLSLDLGNKTGVGGVHIYQGNFVYLRNLHLKNQNSVDPNSKWGVRVGNYTSGSPDGTASHGTIIENLRITNCNTGTFEQLLFVNQQDARIVNPYFEGNTNSLAYELMLYVNNKNVVIENPHFENCSANSIGMMESDGIIVNSITADHNADYKLLTVINTRNVLVDGVVAKNTTVSPTATAFDFFDRLNGPDGFTQIVDDTEKVTIRNVKLDGWKTTAFCQLVGLVSGTDYTMNQNEVQFKNVIVKNQSVPFNLGLDNSLNNLNNWDFEDVRVLAWTGTTTGAWQIRGYTSGVGQMYGFRYRNCKVVPSTGVGSFAAIRNIGATIEYVRDCDFSGTFTGYGALSTVSGGVWQRVANVKGINPEVQYSGGNTSTAITVDRANGFVQNYTATGNFTATFTNGQFVGDRLITVFTQDATGSRTITLSSNAKPALGTTLVLSTAASAVDAISWEWDGTNWREVGRAMGRAHSVAEGGTGASTASGARTNLGAVNIAGDTMTGQLNFSGTTHAGIKLLSLTTTQRDALTPAAGMLIYNTTNNRVEKYEAGAWAPTGGTGSGDVVGPASAQDNGVVRFDGTTGKLVQDSGAALDDLANLTLTAPSATTPDQAGVVLKHTNGTGTSTYTISQDDYDLLKILRNGDTTGDGDAWTLVELVSPEYASDTNDAEATLSLTTKSGTTSGYSRTFDLYNDDYSRDHGVGFREWYKGVSPNPIRFEYQDKTTSSGAWTMSGVTLTSGSPNGSYTSVTGVTPAAEDWIWDNAGTSFPDDTKIVSIDTTAKTFVLNRNATATGSGLSARGKNIREIMRLTELRQLLVRKFIAASSSNVAEFGGDIQVDGQITAGGKITNVTDPTSAQDAATKAYVDANAGGISEALAIAYAVVL